MADPEHTPEELEAITARVYASLRRRSDYAWAQLAIAQIAGGLAEVAAEQVGDRDGEYPLEDIDIARQIALQAQELVRATVLAARLRGKSWDAIGEALTGETGKKQTMINRYGGVEQEWRDGLLEPIATDAETFRYSGMAARRLAFSLSSDTAEQEARLQRFLDRHRPGDRLTLPEEDRLARSRDYLWRLDAMLQKFMVTDIPPALAADIDARKADSLSADADRTDKPAEETR